MSTGTLALLLMMNLAGDHTLLAHVKQFQKIFICCHSSDICCHSSDICCHSSDTKRKPFYHAHISPHLTYASTVWDGCSDILAHLILLTEELQQIQSLGILPLKEKLMFNKAVLVFKAYKNRAPPYLKQLFICSNIRATSRYITLPKPRIDLFKTSFSFSGASLWNTIPNQIKSCSSLTSFKTQLYKWIRSSLL